LDISSANTTVTSVGKYKVVQSRLIRS